MKTHKILNWKKGLSIVLSTILCCAICFSKIHTQSSMTVKGSIGKSTVISDSNKVIIYGIASNFLDNAIFENINICISIPDQGINNPNISISQNFIPTLDWTYAGTNYPDIIAGRAYYTFIGNDNDKAIPVNWSANVKMPIIELSFTGGQGRARIQLNDLTEVEGIGSGGGPSAQSFWYVQVNALGDITDYENKFFRSTGSQIPQNGGIHASSFVETNDDIVLPVIEFNPSDWKLYPNPTSNRIHVIPAVSGLLYFRFYDMSGRLLSEEKTELSRGHAVTIDCSQFVKGNYIFEVFSNENVVLFKQQLVIQRN